MNLITRIGRVEQRHQPPEQAVRVDVYVTDRADPTMLRGLDGSQITRTEFAARGGFTLNIGATDWPEGPTR
jgi:hypothetical protein